MRFVHWTETTSRRLEQVPEAGCLLYAGRPALTQWLSLVHIAVLLPEIEERGCGNTDSDCCRCKVDDERNEVAGSVEICVGRLGMFVSKVLRLYRIDGRQRTTHPDVRRIADTVDHGDCHRALNRRLRQAARDPGQLDDSGRVKRSRQEHHGEVARTDV